MAHESVGVFHRPVRLSSVVSLLLVILGSSTGVLVLHYVAREAYRMQSAETTGTLYKLPAWAAMTPAERALSTKQASPPPAMEHQVRNIEGGRIEALGVSGSEPLNAFDGDITSTWETGPGSYLRLDMGRVYKLRSIELDAGSTGYQVTVSQDKRHWENLRPTRGGPCQCRYVEVRRISPSGNADSIRELRITK